MISDYHRYVGSALNGLIDASGPGVRVRRLIDLAAGFYLLDDTLPVLIKFSRSRRGPWAFNFHRTHQEQFNQALTGYGDCIAVFVCGSDGVAAIDASALGFVLDDVYEEQEVVSVKRGLNKMYAISGRNGKYDRKVSRSSFATLVAEKLHRSSTDELTPDERA